MRVRLSAGALLAGLAVLVAGCAALDGVVPDAAPPLTIADSGPATTTPRELVALPFARSTPATAPRRGTAVGGATALAAVKASREATPAKAEPLEFDVIPVHWGTDRKMPARAMARAPTGGGTAGIATGSIDRAVLPGAERGDRLATGRSYVTVPRIARDKGSIQRPRLYGVLNVTLYSENEDPRRHFTIGSFEPMDGAVLARVTSETLAQAVRNPGQALVFVHGYNSTFEDALYRTAQLAHDLEFDGVPYMYSWPSKGEETAYVYDRDSADRAQRFFLEFLELIARDPKVQRVHLIAHSLGNRPLLEALKATGGRAGQGRRLKIDQVVLAAPDVDRDVFVEIARAIDGASRGVTLYAAANDRALQLSRTLARGVPRAGDVPPGGPVVVAGVETIDITAAGTAGLLAINHNTYAEGGHILADLRILLRDGIRPPDRRFAVYRPMPSATGTWWKYVRN